MRKFYRCIKKYGMLVLPFLLFLLSIVLPLVFNKMFQQPAKNDWMEYSSSTGDLLTYFVSILSVVGTFLLGAVAYEQNKRLLKLESYSKKIFLKINIEKCHITEKNDNTYLSIELENINQDVPISEIKVEKSDKRVMKNKFIENNKLEDKGATFITELKNQDDEKSTSDVKNINYTFDISDFANVSYKIFSFAIKTESLFGENNKQFFNIYIIKDEIKNYMTKIE